MASRFYLPASTAATPISPTPDAGWEDITFLGRARTHIVANGDAMADVAIDDGSNADRDVLFRQYVSYPLKTGITVTGGQAIRFQVRAQEANAGNNLFTALGVRIIGSDGSTVRKVMLAVTRDATELVVTPTAATNRALTATSAATNYTVQAGDRLVIEIGVAGDPSGGNHHDSFLRLGDAAASDLGSNDTDTTDNRPWVEFADTWTFVYAATGAATLPGLNAAGTAVHTAIFIATGAPTLPNLVAAGAARTGTEVLVSGDIRENFLSGPYWYGPHVGVIIATSIINTFAAYYTLNGGTSWTYVDSGIDNSESFLSCWWDGQTVGFSGFPLVHVTGFQNRGDASGWVMHLTFDIRTLSWSAGVNATALLTPAFIKTAIVRTRSGHIIINSLDDSGSSGSVTRRSTDQGQTWADIADLDDGSDLDWFLGVYCDTDDDDDAAFLWYDANLGSLKFRVFDASAGTWTTTALSTGGGITTLSQTQKQWEATTRLSDGRVLLFSWTSVDSATADLRATELLIDSVATPTTSTKTIVQENSPESIVVGAFINQDTNDVYVVWLEGTSVNSTIDVYYSVSTDDMTTWGAPVLYSTQHADDLRAAIGGAMLPGMGARWMPAWRNDDTNDVWVSLTNSIAIAATAFDAYGISTLPSLAASGTSIHKQSAAGAVILPSLLAAGDATVAGGAPTGDGAATLPSLTASGTAVHEQTASGDVTLPSLTAAGTAVHEQTASGAATLPSLTADGAAVHEQTASGAVTLPSLTASGTGTHPYTATGAATLPSLAAAGDAIHEQTASGAVTLPALTASGVGVHPILAAGAATLPSLTAAGSAIHEQTATGASTLPSLMASGTAVMQPSATGEVTLPSLTASGTAIHEQTATGEATLPSLLASGDAVHEQMATGSATLPSLTAAGTGVMQPSATGAVTLPSLAASGTAVHEQTATGAVTLPSLLAEGSATHTAVGATSGSGAVTLPSLTASGDAIHEQTATGSVTLPSLTASGAGTHPYTATGVATLPSLTASGTAVVEQAATGTLTLPSLLASGSALHRQTASGAATLPNLLATGTARQRIIASGAVALPSLTAASTGEQTQTSTAAPTLPSLLASGTALVRFMATGAATLPSLVALGLQGTIATGAATLPSLVAAGEAMKVIPLLDSPPINLHGRFDPVINLRGRYSPMLRLKARFDPDTFSLTGRYDGPIRLRGRYDRIIRLKGRYDG